MSEKIAGVVALIAFVFVLMIGIFFEQPIDEIMMKALVALVIFYILGFIFGEVGSMVVLENMERFDLQAWTNTEGKELGIHMEGDKIVVNEEVVEEEAQELPEMPGEALVEPAA